MSAEIKNGMNMYRYNRGPGRRNNIVILVSDELENLFILMVFLPRLRVIESRPNAYKMRGFQFY